MDNARFTLGLITFVILIAFLVYLCCRRNTRKPKDYRAAIEKLVSPNVVAYYERPRWSIDLTKNLCLGVGQYVHVYNGAMLGKNIQNPRHQTTSGCRPVAVRMFRDSDRDWRGTADFLAEMSILMTAGRHVNIVNLEAVVLKGGLMMIMEHCELGYLETYLRMIKEKTKNLLTTQVGIDITELVSISHQISRGMEYLSLRGIVHRDLAARNVLLAADKTVKIAHFGMTREQPEYNLECDKIPLPVRWMAPESIQPACEIFTSQRDVWSFGVVLWEIFSLGDIPYAAEFPKGITYSLLCSFLQEGHRLLAPELCPKYVEQLMATCWTVACERRPSFTSIRENLECLLSATERARYIISDAENETLSRTILYSVDKVH